MDVLLADVVATSAAVSATRSRLAKTAAVADLLAAADLAELEVVVSYLSGTLMQRRTGLGWKGVADLPAPADTACLEVAEVDAAFEEIAAVAGAGSQARRRALVADLFGRATHEEQRMPRGLVTGELRQGAQEGTVVEAIAKAADVPATDVRRAVMLGGALGPVAVAARTGGIGALERFTLQLMRPVRPMLAGSAPTIAEAAADHPDEAQIWDTKLDGIRIQVHLDRSSADQQVRIWTRSLDEITTRLPEVVETVLALPAETLVLDGEAIALTAEGRPRPFQETGSRTATRSPSSAAEVPVTAFFYDLLHVDGRDLLDDPLTERLVALDRVVPEDSRTPRLLTADADEAQAFFDTLIARGHEGVIVKRPGAPYEAGRRGSGWVKVRPVHTLDLVVLAVEWGSGRRRGKLSNIHLGARDPETGELIMVGKTFKGMTDEMLAWQTERFLSLETGRDGHVVHVRPEQVVEIAYDGVQRSTRYPGGVALRFARVLRYRDDKTADQADVIRSLQTVIEESRV